MLTQDKASMKKSFIVWLICTHLIFGLGQSYFVIILIIIMLGHAVLRDHQEACLSRRTPDSKHCILLPICLLVFGCNIPLVILGVKLCR
jgi:uncharacterized membrane-anchored protein YitT (DUF2179 family)